MTSRRAERSAVLDGAQGQYLEEVIAFPALPFTEQFGNFDPNFPNLNQALMINPHSGHVQLSRQVASSFLYEETNYAFETVTSKKILDELTLLIEFMGRNVEQSNSIPTRMRVLEFGSNNLLLAEMLEKRFGEVHAVDPLGPDSHPSSNIHPRATTIEKVLESSHDIFDVIVARHTLEHIPEPLELMRTIRERISEKGFVFFEVPDFDALINRRRFDAITHQHLQYFDESSFYFLASGSDFRVSRIARNPIGSNGGSLIVCLQPSGPNNDSGRISDPGKKEKIRAAWNRFRVETGEFVQAVESFDGPKLLYGAGHMLATYNYHTHGLFETFDSVIDDNVMLHGVGYKNLPLVVSSLDSRGDFSNSLVTPGSLENHEVLSSKILRLSPGKYVPPVCR